MKGSEPDENKEKKIYLSEVDKRAKAENIFNDLHEKVKPFFIIAKGLKASDVIEMALQPNNKNKIIDEIARRLWICGLLKKNLILWKA